MNNEFALFFSKKKFTIASLIILLATCIMLLVVPFSTFNLIFTGFFFFLFFITNMLKSKNFYARNSQFEIQYAFFRNTINIPFSDIIKIELHKAKGERDWNFIRIFLRSGKKKKYIFLFINQESISDFFEKLNGSIIINNV